MISLDIADFNVQFSSKIENQFNQIIEKKKQKLLHYYHGSRNTIMNWESASQISHITHLGTLYHKL